MSASTWAASPDWEPLLTVPIALTVGIGYNRWIS